MADYNIYIHAVGGGTSSPTTPWGAKGTGGTGGGAGDETTSSWDSSLLKGVSKATSTIQNPDGLVAEAVDKFTSSIPYVAAAIAVVKLGTYLIDESMDVYTTTTGDYRDSVAWDNFKAGFRAVFNPASTLYAKFKEDIRINVENEKRRQHLELLGDSVINSYSKRGV